jgi:carbon monoxide dehydrogenase subunit G
MATARAHIRIARPTDEVWSRIADPIAIVDWFPGVATCTLASDVRTVTTDSGMTVDEQVVTNDADLRRFQYRLVDVPGFAHHLATVDVLDDDAGGAIVVYGVDVAPDELGPAMTNTLAAAVEGLKRSVEGG